MTTDTDAHESGGIFDFDINTMEGARNAVRPLAVLLFGTATLSLLGGLAALAGTLPMVALSAGSGDGGPIIRNGYEFEIGFLLVAALYPLWMALICFLAGFAILTKSVMAAIAGLVIAVVRMAGLILSTYLAADFTEPGLFPIVSFTLSFLLNAFIGAAALLALGATRNIEKMRQLNTDRLAPDPAEM